MLATKSHWQVFQIGVEGDLFLHLTKKIVFDSGVELYGVFCFCSPSALTFSWSLYFLKCFLFITDVTSGYLSYHLLPNTSSPNSLTNERFLFGELDFFSLTLFCVNARVVSQEYSEILINTATIKPRKSQFSSMFGVNMKLKLEPLVLYLYDFLHCAAAIWLAHWS